jgi:hypothetical protein
MRSKHLVHYLSHLLAIVAQTHWLHAKASHPFPSHPSPLQSSCCVEPPCRQARKVMSCRPSAVAVRVAVHYSIPRESASPALARLGNGNLRSADPHIELTVDSPLSQTSIIGVSVLRHRATGAKRSAQMLFQRVLRPFLMVSSEPKSPPPQHGRKLTSLIGHVGSSESVPKV